MINNKNNDFQSQLDRMKSLMKYGINESKQPYTGVEYIKEGADGKTYGIVREGVKFYIKESAKKGSMLSEDYSYIGGFRNRKDNEYTSFAMAQKNFDLKMQSINEAYGNGKRIVVESWNPDKREELTVEATDKMKREIMRERQIMENISNISRGQAQSESMPLREKDEKGCEDGKCSAPFTEDPEKEIQDSQKNNMRKQEHGGGGNYKKVNGYTNAKIPKEMTVEGTVCKKCGKKECTCGKMNESEQVLGWNDNKDYIDDKHGTEIGDGTPYNIQAGKDIDDKEYTAPDTGDLEDGTVVKEEVAMYDSQDQNKPAVGVDEVGDGKPYEEKVNEAIDDLDDAADIDDAAPEGDDTEIDVDVDSADGEDTELDIDTEEEPEGEDEFELETEEDGDIDDRLSAIEDKLDRIVRELGVSTYDDNEDLYDDETGEGDEDEEEPIEDCEVFESVNYKKMMRENKRRMIREEEDEAQTDGEGPKEFSDAGRVPQGNMNKLDKFGDHPAWQKTVMKLPNPDMREKNGYYDMNDKSVKSTAPYGEKIGDSTPYNIKLNKHIDNSIQETINRYLKKNK